jgi:hypothetical protein
MSVAQTVKTKGTARIQPSPGYQPGANSPLKPKEPPKQENYGPDGPTVVREMIEEGLEDLNDNEEWVLHCSCLTFWTFLSAIIGMFMILMSRSMTELFYSLPQNDVLFGFGIAFELPLLRWLVILFFPNQAERDRRKRIREKRKQRNRENLRGTRFQIMEDMYQNKLTPALSQHTIYYNNNHLNDNVSVLTAPTMAVSRQGGDMYSTNV